MKNVALALKTDSLSAFVLDSIMEQTMGSPTM